MQSEAPSALREIVQLRHFTCSAGAVTLCIVKPMHVSERKSLQQQIVSFLFDRCLWSAMHLNNSQRTSLIGLRHPSLKIVFETKFCNPCQLDLTFPELRNSNAMQCNAMSHQLPLAASQLWSPLCQFGLNESFISATFLSWHLPSSSLLEIWSGLVCPSLQGIPKQKNTYSMSADIQEGLGTGGPKFNRYFPPKIHSAITKRIRP